MLSKPYAFGVSFILLLLVLCFSFLTNLAFLPIRVWDEGRVVTNALNMHLNGNWIVTYFDGQPDLWNTKPPLLIWLQVISIKIFGTNEWAVRFPSAMASILNGLLLLVFSRRYLNSTWIGFLAGCVFASTYAFVFNHAGRTGDYDALLTLFTTAYCLSFYLFCTSGENKWLISFFTFLTLAALTKGIAALFFAPALLIYIITQNRLLSFLKNRFFYIGVVSFLFIGVGYYFLRNHFNPGYIKAVLEGELGSYPKTLNHHEHAFTWYLTNMVEWRYPYWYWLVIPAFVFGFFIRSIEIRKLTLFNLVLVTSYLLIISVANTKLYWYDLPIYPFFSLQIALMLYTFWEVIKSKIALPGLIQNIIVASFLFAMVFTQPFRVVRMHNKHVHSVWPWDVDAEDRHEGLFLQQAIQNREDLNNYIFCFDACDRCHAQIDFYITILRSKMINVHFQDNLKSLTPGSHIVISQPAMKQQLESSYNVQLEKEAYGCSVYIIK